eukprot:CAMPEP_0172495782 /NCGR_PEP_ID=MMETSP1066-20121228/76797_1 /TAXON_ID=671091 /ORGANISM="Coscinodiscus wailesii, Strain CCMP2513" /LENGTH=128 /DNA_ID=CAMNT_0013267693 /DNA_START=136 /DNA_END=522 /DNA_ORIENTATION=-
MLTLTNAFASWKNSSCRPSIETSGKSKLHIFKSFWGESLSDAARRRNLPDNFLEAARDPVKFEKMVMDLKSDEKSKPRQPYKRAEDWEKELDEKRANMTWEEKVQFEGQRNGDQFRQNEILKRNLNGF